QGRRRGVDADDGALAEAGREEGVRVARAAAEMGQVPPASRQEHVERSLAEKREVAMDDRGIPGRHIAYAETRRKAHSPSSSMSSNIARASCASSPMVTVADSGSSSTSTR